VRDITSICCEDLATRRFVLAVLALTTLLVVVPSVLDLLHRRGAPVPPLSRWLKAGSDGSIPEIFSYVLAAATAGLLYRTWRLSGVRFYRALSALFIFILLDDSLKYHENTGEILATRFRLTRVLGLRPDHVGELIAWGLAGAILVVPILLSLRQRVPRVLGVAGVFLFCFGALVFFEAGFDLLHSATDSWLLGYVEDQGAMIALGLAFVCALALYRGYRVPELAARHRLPKP
jgi:hypothetical protein